MLLGIENKGGAAADCFLEETGEGKVVASRLLMSGGWQTSDGPGSTGSHRQL